MWARIPPYTHEFKANTKRRWIGRRLVDVMLQEFSGRNEAYYLAAIQAGAIRVNGKRADEAYRLKDGDLISHIVHRHEPPAPTDDVEILHRDTEIIVANKPCGLPVHPNSAYTRNTLTEALKRKCGEKHLSAINRLDKQTSGIVVLAVSPESAQKYHGLMAGHGIRKYYLAAIRGRLPDKVVVVDVPLHISPSTCTTQIKREGSSFSGKRSITLFKHISTAPEHSVVLCRPITGRTHQIRVHLQVLGYPIVNDQLYTRAHTYPEIQSLLQSPGKESILVTEKALLNEESGTHKMHSREETLAPKMHEQAEHTGSINAESNDAVTGVGSGVVAGEGEGKQEIENSGQKGQEQDFVISSCLHCQSPAPLFSGFSSLFLHAFHYILGDHAYTTGIPGWCKAEAEEIQEGIRDLEACL